MTSQESFAPLNQLDHAPSAELLSISVVMPSYNRCDRLEKVLQHIAKQAYSAELVEVVVCLDGCSDNSAAMLRRLQADYPMRLVIIEQPQSGPAAARNRAIQAASNEIVLFLDDDVFPVPELFRAHVEHHRQHNDVVIIGPMQPPDNFERPFWVRWEEAMLERQYSAMLAGEWEASSRQFYTGNCSLYRHWLVETGGFDENFKRAEDVELAWRLNMLDLRFHFEPAAVGYHYATRSYQSWETTRYQYGKYDVVMGRDKGYYWVLELAYEDFERRNWLTRQVCKYAVGRPRLYDIVRKGLSWAAKGLVLARQEPLSYKVLSMLANILYWQGLQDELAKQPVEQAVQLAE